MGIPDISRDSFDETKDYIKVIQEQGRPFVDYDYNELQDILRYLLKMSVQFIVGINVFDADGFKVVGTGLSNDFTVKSGKALINGLFCFNRSDKLASELGITLTTPTADRTDYVYLDIWQEFIDSTQDTSIKHPNLPIETSQRLKLRKDIKIIEGGTVPTAPQDHIYVTLAQINRKANVSTINSTDIIDLREVFTSYSSHKYSNPIDHPDGSVTDSKIGSRTITDTIQPTSDTAQLQTLLSNLAYMIKTTTGKSNWRTNPDVNLAAVYNHINNTNNPHGVTATQTGAENLINTHKNAAILDHLDGSVTDNKIGNRTVDDTLVPSSNTNKLLILLSNLANRIKTITGKTDWKTSPDTNLVNVYNHINNTNNPHNVTAAQVGADILVNNHKNATTLDHPDNSVTDSKIGARLITDTSSPTADSGTITSLFSWLAYMIKSITGKTNWRTVPDVNLATVKQHIDASSPHTGHATTTDLNNHINNTNNPHNVTAAQTGADILVNNHKNASTLDHPDNSVIDSKIGNRTINDTLYPTADTSNLTTLLSWLANRIKTITGKTSWQFNPDVNLVTVNNHINNTNNPHNVTLTQLNAVNKSGDTINGNLQINGDFLITSHFKFTYNSTSNSIDISYIA
ncbi:DUF6519 domain-containing protein [Thermosipho sp. (in: thermotogales)]|jgi:hypothetical protein|uniref:DUF6519 domain-containing protein n=1 Tax=Thermosipho sp. (in: thermotogales) TaxID=1968895 RepID=UPI00257F980E|nr:DUF6519 domain-containing protein [Thermosipho sp. (in: thermotogales)]MBZ4649168.1 hypothetical protein [Thermosipho sp. (in: thermotogales)]